MYSRKFVAGAVLAGLAALGAGVSSASATVTYHFAESAGAFNSTGGIFGGPGGTQIHNPVTFDFTIAAALAANTTYNFGVTGVENGDSGNVLDFRFSDGTLISTFSLADEPAHLEIRGGPFSTNLSRIHLQTDATGAIQYYDILMAGRSTFNTDEVIGLQLQHTQPGGVAIVMSGYDYGGAGGTYRFTSGSLQCVLACTGGFTSAPGGIGGAGAGGAGGVPEPAAWALMILGMGGVGSLLRRRQGLGLRRA
jgi:hypothetical protein